MEDLAGKVAVVTGAASGIGNGLANAFAAEGMKVVLADIEQGPLDDAVAALRAGGADVVGVRTDVSKGDQVDALATTTLDTFGAVHVVCNNAGVGGGGTMWQLTTADWEWVLGVNLWGVIHGIRAFVPHLVAQGEGHVVNTASMAGLTSPPGMGPYNASKHAVVTISETLSGELALYAPGVGVSVLCPGWVSTRITDSARNRPVELANEVEQVTMPQTELLRETIDAMVRGGMAPSEVARQVVEAVKARRLYVLTHGWSDAVRARMEAIADSAPAG